MSNKPKPARAAIPASPKPSRSAAQPARTPLIIGAVVAVVLVVGLIVALVVSGGGDDDDDAALQVTQNGVAICDEPAASDTAAAADGADESDPLAPFPADNLLKPVRVLGDPLPESGPTSGDDVDEALCRDAPIVEGYDYGGDVVTIDPASDGPTLVVLLAHWCPHCNNEIPVLNAWRDSGEMPEDLDVVGVSTGVRRGEANYPPDRWLVEKDWQWPVVVDDGDSTVMQAFGGTSYPTLLFFGSDGRLRARVSGEIPIDAIAAIVDDVLAQEDRSATDPA